MASGERMTKAERERRIAALRKSGALVPAGSAPGGVPGGSWLFPPDIARKVDAMTIDTTLALQRRHERHPDLFPSPYAAEGGWFALCCVPGCPGSAVENGACQDHRGTQVCEVPGCGTCFVPGKTGAKGKCSRHYRAARSDRPLTAERDGERACRVKGCPDPVRKGAGDCWRHYRHPEAPAQPERAKPGEGRQRTVRVTLNFTQEQGERLARAALNLGETKPGKLAARWVLERLKGESHG